MLRSLLAAAAFATLAFAQTSSKCDPTKKSCPDAPALGTSYNATFDQNSLEFDPNLWTIEAGTKLISFGKNGAELALRQKGQSVTLVSKFYIFWGTFEILFQAAAGQGIISTGILLSDDLDEIDWEFIGSNTTTISNNWFGKGNQDQRNAEYPALDNGQNSIHNYTVDWNKDRIQYIMDGKVVRTVNAGAPGDYPQTPSFVRFGIWSGGDSDSQGTREWAGGATDWSKAPYIMRVKSLRVVDGTQNATSYGYGDKSGSWQSIKVTNGQSDAYKVINKISGTQNAMNAWNGLSTAAKIGIACGIAGALALGMLAWCVFCCIQRRKGREEKRIADKEWDDHQNELLQYRRMQQKGQFSVSHNDYRASNKF